MRMTITIENKFEFVISYFDQVFMKYLTCDIKSIQEIELTEEKLKAGSCAAPLAMSVLSSMNQLGFLTSKKTTKKIEDLVDTELCIKEYCTDWMAKIDAIYNKGSIQDMLVSFFRHGMAHQLLPTGNSGITRSKTQKELFNRIPVPEDKYIYVMNADILSDSMLKSLPLLEDKLLKSKDTDVIFIERFYSRLQYNMNRYSKIHNIISNKVEKNLEIPDRDLTTTISGMPSDTSAIIDCSWAKRPSEREDK